MNRWHLAAALTIVAWCAIELLVRRPDTITDDWQGWRQADTQAIARNLAQEEFDPLRPRIDWRGDGPGYVETELQLYPTLIALAMKASGESELPGQLFSLLFVALAAALLHRALARRFGDRAAYVALLAVLSMQGTIVMGTSIQPDSLAFLLYVVGFVAFLDRRHALWIAATLLAALVKPTTLELGVTQFVFVVLTDRAALRRPVLWIGWGLVLAGVALFLLHARSLYVEYGNTFGIFSGGDSKLPAASALANPRTWIDLARFTIVWGIGIPAVPALLFLLWRRALGKEELALAAGSALLLLVALRYTSGPFGTHYHLPHVVLGAWLVARAVAELERATHGSSDSGPTARVDRLARRGTPGGAYTEVAARRLAARARGLLIAAAVAALLLEARALRYVRAQQPQPETSVGRMLATRATPGTLVVVRARAPRIDPDWHTVNNCEDPRVFYLSRTKGWVLANDEPGAAPVAQLHARGARFYAHVNQMPPDADLAVWLAAHADVVATSDAGTVYALR